MWKQERDILDYSSVEQQLMTAVKPYSVICEICELQQSSN